MPPKDDAKEKAPGGDAGTDAEVQGLNPNWLKGLTFRGATAKKTDVDGREVTKYIPFERPLEMGDVLDWKDKGASISIVTKDGRKYAVKKGGK